jgi:arylsulfatase A-like enzyme
MATVLDAAGGAYPSTFQGRAIHPLEGKSLLPTFQGRPRELHEAIYWEHEGNRAIKQGDWKLVSRYPDSWSLFNLAEDRTELRDRSLEEQSRVRDMAALWNAWAQRSNVLPWEELHQPNL